ncbi:MAG: NUDIX domain-containing protein [Candidatus Paceibacterota bacterium]
MQDTTKPKLKCVLHGSFRKHFKEIRRVHQLFSQNGIEVLAPTMSDIKSFDGGFAILESDQERDQRLIELLYLHNLKKLDNNGFSYFVNPDGYIGRTASYELGIAQASNARCFFSDNPDDHPVYIHENSIWKPEDIVEYINKFGQLPEPKIKRNEKAMHRLWEELVVPGSVVAAGAIIEYSSPKHKEKEILLVKTHKWRDRYSVVGGKVRRNERLEDALMREIKEETGLRSSIGEHICTFDQIKNSGYYESGTQHIFVDKIARVNSKNVRLNEEAQEYIWIPPEKALRELEIEPNARHTLELYTKMFVR